MAKKKKRRKHKNAIEPLPVAITLGTFSSIVLFLTSFAMMLGWGHPMVERVIAAYYIGYSATVMGTLVGIVWAFVDGFIGGYLFSVLYNRVVIFLKD